MPMEKPGAAARERYRALADEVLVRVGAKDSTMFGMPTLKTQAGKAFCGLFGDDMVFKLTDPGALADARDLPGATAFDPDGGRPMREWVRLGPEHEDRYLELALLAHEGVSR